MPSTTIRGALFLSCCLGAVTVLAMVSPELRWTLRALLGKLPPGSASRPWDVSKDPQLGSSVPEFAQDTMSDAGGGAVLVVLVGNCSECVARPLRGMLSANQSRLLTIIVHTPNVGDDMTAWLAAQRIDRILVDADRKLHQKLNAAFTPRAYLFDSDGTLADLQRAPSQKEFERILEGAK